MKVAIRLLLQGFIGVGLLVIAWEIAVWMHPPLMAFTLASAGRVDVCSPRQSLAGTQLHKRVNSDFAIAKLISRSSDGFTEYQTTIGRFWVPPSAEGVLSRLVSQQVQDIYSAATMIRPGNIVLDCGAHVGVYTRKALDAGAGLVVAIEPAPENVEALQRNFKAEIAAGRVIVVPEGVWDKEEQLALFEDPTNSAADSFVTRADSDIVRHTIAVGRIDVLAKRLNLSRVDVIKMDIKGATERALHGATEVIARDQPRVALSVEELDDPAPAVLATSRAVGIRHAHRCGSCAVTGDYRVRPEVLLFE